MGRDEIHAGSPPGTGPGGQENLAVSLAAEQAARSLAEHLDDWIDRLRSAATEAVTSLSLDEVMRTALSEIAANLQVDEAALLIAAEDGSELVARTAVGLIREVELGIHIPAGAGFAGRILASGAPLIVNDLGHFQVHTPTLRDSGLSSIVGVPMIVGDRVLGVLHAGSRAPRRFTDADRAVLEVIAYPIAAAIERVRLFESERRLRQVAELSARRLAALQRITSALAGAREAGEVFQTVLDHAPAGVAGRDGHPGIWMLRDGRLRRVGGGGPDAGAFPEVPLDSSLPAAAQLEGAEPLFVETREEMLARWPVLATTGTSAFAGFPLVANGARVGIMSIAFDSGHRFDDDERAYLTAVAEQAGLALGRALRAEAEAEAEERQAFLAETSLALTNRYASPAQLLDTLVRLAVPRLADRCAVLFARGGRVELVASSHRLDALSPDERARLAGLLSTGRIDAVEKVLSTGRSQIVGGFDDPSLDLGERGRLAAAVGLTSAMLVPLERHATPAGVMVFLACGTHPRYRAEDLEVATELARRAGALADDLIQRDRERTLAETLTRALLPAELPRLPGIELAARYQPAESGPVGGDWYDAFALRGRRVGLVVGDVGGHGVEAASTMARLRNGLVAFASEGHEAASIFDRLSGLLSGEWTSWNLPDPIATLLFAVLDQATLTLEVTSAGHPPWLLVRDGSASLQPTGGRVLAGGLEAAPAGSRHQLSPGDVCVFMTDGLVERPGEDLSESLSRLEQAARSGTTTDLKAFAHHLLEATMPAGGRRDDCCLLAVRIGSPARSPRRGPGPSR